MTSFGKMILSKNDSRPQYSFAQTKRSSTTNNGNNKVKTDYLYRLPAVYSYKYYKSPGWGFGTSSKSNPFEKQKYDYYNQPYNYQCDTSSLTKKKWKTIGGHIGNSLKSSNSFREKSPGPGRYNPNSKVIQYKSPSYGIGARLNHNGSFVRKTGTNRDVSPCSYELADKSDKHKFPFAPKCSIGRDKRKENILPKNTMNETYIDYSSLGFQTISPKCSEPKMSFSKAPRFRSSNKYF